jgi:hypothetical protein
MLDRDLYRNAWELVPDIPQVVFHRDGDPQALIRYAGGETNLRAHLEDGEGESRQYLMVSGFAARAVKGRKIWSADVEFWRKRGEKEWVFHQVYVWRDPESRLIPVVVGFIKDFPENVRARSDRSHLVQLRARVG